MAIKLQAKSLSDLLVRYEAFTNGDTELEWNEYITAVEKKSLLKHIENGTELINSTRVLRGEFVKLIDKLNDEMKTLTYKGSEAIKETEKVMADN
jgi:hypothetical protein